MDGGWRWELVITWNPVSGLVLLPDGSLFEVRVDRSAGSALPSGAVPPDRVEETVDRYMNLLFAWSILRS